MVNMIDSAQHYKWLCYIELAKKGLQQKHCMLHIYKQFMICSYKY